jgi:hypothetical protein
MVAVWSYPSKLAAALSRPEPLNRGHGQGADDWAVVGQDCALPLGRVLGIFPPAPMPVDVL